MGIPTSLTSVRRNCFRFHARSPFPFLVRWHFIDQFICSIPRRKCVFISCRIFIDYLRVTLPHTYPCMFIRRSGLYMDRIRSDDWGGLLSFLGGSGQQMCMNPRLTHQKIRNWTGQDYSPCTSISLRCTHIQSSSSKITPGAEKLGWGGVRGLHQHLHLGVAAGVKAVDDDSQNIVLRCQGRCVSKCWRTSS